MDPIFFLIGFLFGVFLGLPIGLLLRETWREKE